MSLRRLSAIAFCATILALFDHKAFAAEALNGSLIPTYAGLPFAGILLSIALCPLLVKEWWHAHYGKAASFWAAFALFFLIQSQGIDATAGAFVHTMALEYIPFILMLFALFTASGGITIAGNLHGSPRVNVALLAIGAGFASIVGTTGASMILIRPLIRANDERRFNVHVVVFFIFLVSNIGGALTPLGDPPLFLGFLRGIDFFWTGKILWPETLFATVILLAVFFALDTFLYRREESPKKDPSPDAPLQIQGTINFGLIAVAIGAIVMSGIWKPGIGFDILGTRIEAQNLLRETIMLIVGLASLRLTSKKERLANGFEWEPLKEVAKLFAGIFTCIIPVMAMLQAGLAGPFASVIKLLTSPSGEPRAEVYFWATGLLSSFLDNAPTYLVFFELAGGDPQVLMGRLANTLAAISLGAVFMGANTYIGNAPNFMVYAIARSAGIAMPSFFGYMLWSGAILLPLFALITWIFLV
jgi:Na+/H+ antiporter NhaD/arsenite permease-like protein